MTTPIPAPPFAGPAPAQRLEQAAAALTAHGSPSKSSMTPPPRVPASKT
jgi:hypothetical protein